MHKGIFIAIEGPDGSGKTSVIKELMDTLPVILDQEVIFTREPGGTYLGEKIRTLLLNDQMCSMTEMLLFAASRAEHLSQLIEPAVKQGKIVITDRFNISSFAYQGFGRELQDETLMVNDLVVKRPPDIVIFLNADFDICQQRLNERSGKQDRLDKEATDFKRRLYDGYQYFISEKLSDKTTLMVVNANDPQSDVAQTILRALPGMIKKINQGN